VTSSGEPQKDTSLKRVPTTRPPYLLSKNAVKFLLLSYFQTREFERRIAGDFRVHVVEGDFSVKMPVIMHVSNVSANPLELIRSRREAGGGLVVLDDAEAANPPNPRSAG